MRIFRKYVEKIQVSLKNNKSNGDLKTCVHRGADKYLARPGRKQATATEDFDVHISFLLS